MHDITDSPFKSISILYRKSHIWLSAGCAPHGFTAAQAAVILIVCDFCGLTQEQITRRLSLDKSVIAKTVTRLERTGFVTRCVSLRDRRTYDIRPTEKAWQAYPVIREQLEECFRRMTQGMTDQQRQQFRELLSLAARAAVAQEDEL